MCTLVILPTSTGLVAAANRDELRTRARGLPPQVHGNALWPTDPDGGGTWLGVSDRGVLLGLLNRYEPPAGLPVEPIHSRGQLIPALLPLPDLEAMAAHLQAQGDVLRHIRPFDLAMVAAGPPARGLLISWDGLHLRTVPLELPVVLASVAFSVEATREQRRQELAALLAALDLDADRRVRDPAEVEALLPAWMARHDTTPWARAICLHHPLAQTVSLSLVHVSDGQVRMRYHDGPPCEPGTWTEGALPRS